MTTGQRIAKTVTVKKQAGLGTPASGSGGSVLSRVSSVFQSPSDTFESPVITTHQQSTGVSFGTQKPTGKVESLLSTETFQILLECLLRQDYAAVAPLAAGTDVTASATTPHFVDASAGYLAAGIKKGDVVRWTGWTGGAAANNNKNFFITALTAGNMTGVFMDGSAVVAASAGDSVTVTVQGKKTFAPATGQTNDYITVEEWHSGLSRSEVFQDGKVGSIAVGIPGSGNATFSADIMALLRSRTGAQVLTTPTEPTFRELSAANLFVYLVGSSVTNCTGIQFTITDSAAHGAAVVGSNSAGDISRDIIKVTGQLTAKFDGVTLQDIYDAQAPVSLFGVIAEDATPTSAFVAFSLPAVKLTGDAPDDGQEIVRTYPFVAEFAASGGASADSEQTIFSIQDSQL